MRSLTRPVVVLMAALPTLLSVALLLRVPVADLVDATTGFPAVMNTWVVAVVVLGGLLLAERLRAHSVRRLAAAPAESRPKLKPPVVLSARAERAVLLLVAGSLGPFALFGAMAFGAPEVHPGLWRLVSAAALLPAGLVALLGLLPRAVLAQFTPARAGLFLGAALLALGALEATLAVTRGPRQREHATVTAPDRSYWTFAPGSVLPGSALEHAGLAKPMNSWGFRGAEPLPASPDVFSVLVLGDGIPFGRRFELAVGFPGVAEGLLAGRRADAVAAGAPRVTLLNAGMPGYSTDQIRDLYTRHLAGLPHDLVVFCFVLDDVNREARYPKGGLLYTPTYPEWMQDLYHRSHVVHALLYAVHVRDETFLLHRRRGHDEALPDALAALEACRVEARARGARLAVFEIPRFDWTGVLTRESDYESAGASHAVRQWCAAAGVPYATALPALMGQEIAPLRISRQDLHLTPAGHARVGAALADFLGPLVPDAAVADG